MNELFNVTTNGDRQRSNLLHKYVQKRIGLKR